MQLLKPIVGIAATLWVTLAAPSPASAAARVDNPHTTIELIAESQTPAAGQPLTLGLVLTPKPGWHTYWRNPGDAGAPTRVAWDLPLGTPAPPPLAYPVPDRLIVSGLMNYVYPRQNVLLTSVTPPDARKGSPFPVRVKADWLVCSLELCVPESATLELPLTIGKGAADLETAFRIANARAALPQDVAWPATWAKSGKSFVLAVPLAKPATVRAAYFYPDADGTLNYSAPQRVTATADGLRIETEAGSKADVPVSGLLRVERSGEDMARGYALTAQPGAVPGAGEALPGATTARLKTPAPSLVGVLLAAILGGIILNVMPCVFPILSLKALSLAKGGVAPVAARRDAIGYALGVILVCTALGGAVLALRAAGTQIGWAFQLQDPRVIAALLLLVTAIALNLAGLFEVTVSVTAGDRLTRQGGFGGSFWTGALAAFVATPCTGPFMAGALGAALILPPVEALAVFAGLGLGLALPFLALGFVPALRRRLPKPGVWMNTLRAILSVPMFLTALALAWVLGRQAGIAGMTAGVAGALLLGLALWWLGARQAGGASRWLPVVAAVAAAVALVTLVPTTAPAEANTAITTSGLAAEKFTPERLASLRARKTPVFLYLTADWCLTCKVNERGAMADAGVAAAFRRGGVAVLEGDWTRGDPVISKFLADQGRAGVPLYLFYHADGRVEELPQVLTTSGLATLAGDRND